MNTVSALQDQEADLAGHSGLAKEPASNNAHCFRARWPAFLRLHFERDGQRTRLASTAHEGPLYVQKAFYPQGEGCPHVYLLHPPGGVVSGDALEIGLSLASGARVLATTPGATRLYRSRRDQQGIAPLPQQIDNTLAVAGGACLEWLPGETIVYDGAHVALSTSVSLAAGSSICAWEIVCLGLPASNAPFLSGAFSQLFSVYIEGKPCWIDRLAFHAETPWLKTRCGLQGHSTFGTLVAGPHFRNASQHIDQELRDALQGHVAAHNVAVTCVSGLLLLRYLGGCADEARSIFTLAWETLRPKLTGDAAIHPGIWST